MSEAIVFVSLGTGLTVGALMAVATQPRAIRVAVDRAVAEARKRWAEQDAMLRPRRFANFPSVPNKVETRLVLSATYGGQTAEVVLEASAVEPQASATTTPAGLVVGDKVRHGEGDNELGTLMWFDEEWALVYPKQRQKHGISEPQQPPRLWYRGRTSRI